MNKINLPAILKKQPIALACAFLFIVLVAVFFVRKGTLLAAQAELENKRTDGEHLHENVSNAGKLDEQLAELTQAVQSIETRLVHADQLASNLQYFYKLESDTRVKLSQLNQTGVLSPAKNAAKTNYVPVGYNITVQGNYPEVMDFLRRIESGERFSHVRSLSLSQSSGADAVGKMETLSLTLKLDLLGLP
jgi:Tfp pilus assembly protein PilO